MSDKCIFCKINSNEIPAYIIYENDNLKVILDAFPSTKGHVLIIPKKHVENIFELDEEIGAEIFKIAIQISKIMKNELGNDCEGLNIIQNNGELAGQTVNHFHMHLIPRKKNDNVTIAWKVADLKEEEFNSVMTGLKNKMDK
jgi:histidine triad (HIT) family protein